MTPAALGFRAHSGWAMLVALAGPPDDPAVLDRRRVELADRGLPVQPYHAAEGLELKRAEQIITRCSDRAKALGREAVREVLTQLRQKGHDVVAASLLLGSGRPTPALEQILASHALIHAAEGELYREALRDAAEHNGVPVAGVKERELFAQGSAALGVTVEELQRRLNELGKSLGPPWRQDHKLASLAAWTVLAARHAHR